MMLCKKCSLLLLDTTIDAITRFEHILSCTDEPNDLEQIAALEEEINRYEETLPQLRNLKRRKISLRSTFARLPREITAEIFSHYLEHESEEDSRDYSMTPLFLGMICSVWRDIAWSTPRLWSTVYIHLRDSSLSEVMELLPEWLERSGSCPLSITLAAADEYWDTHDAPSYIIDTIVAHSAQWHSVDFVLPLKYLQYMPPIDLPCLTSLTIKCVDHGYHSLTALISNPIDAFLMAPQLHTINLVCPISPFMMDLPWNQLTTLHGGAFYLAEFFEALKQASNVQHCLFNYIFVNESVYNTPTVPLYNEYLSSLVLHCDNDSSEPLRLAMDFITLPSLRTLEITGPHCRFPANAFFGMLSRSSTKLQQMTTKGMILTDVELAHCLRATPSLVKLDADYIIVQTGEDNTHQDVANPMVLQYLTTFKLSYDNPSGIDFVLNSIVIPAARDVEIKGAGHPFPHTQFLELLNRSRCSLQSLALENVLIDQLQLLQCIPLVPSVVELRLDGLLRLKESEYDDRESLTTEIFSMLCCHPEESICVLPSLETLEYLGAAPYDVAILCDMLESRWKTSAEDNTVAKLRVVTIHSKLYADTHDNDVLARMHQLVKEGLKLAVASDVDTPWI